jgi:hypothetical protein
MTDPLEPALTAADCMALARALTAGGVGSLSPGNGLAIVRVRDAVLALLAHSPDVFPERALLVRYVQALHFVAMCAVHHQAHVINTLEALIGADREQS